MNIECLARSPAGYQRGKARVDKLVADLACGKCDAERFVFVAAACGAVSSETLGLIVGLAERLAAVLLSQRAGASPTEPSA